MFKNRLKFLFILVIFSFTACSDNPVPVITGLSPAEIDAGSPSFTLTVNGRDFVDESDIYFNNIKKTTTYVSDSKLTCTIDTADLETALSGTAPYLKATSILKVKVFNPSPGGGYSNEFDFEVKDLRPEIQSCNPANSVIHNYSTIVTITGTGFTANSTALLNSKTLSTTYYSTTQLTAVISPDDTLPGTTQTEDFNIDDHTASLQVRNFHGTSDSFDFPCYSNYSFTEAKTIGSGNGKEGSSLQIVKDSSNNIYAAWIERRNTKEGNRAIHFSKSSDNGSSWSNIAILSDQPKVSDVSVFALTIDGSDIIRIFWTKYDPNSGLWQNFFTFSTDRGQSFSGPMLIIGEITGYRLQSETDLSVHLNRSSKTLYLSWIARNTYGKYGVYISKKNLGTSTSQNELQAAFDNPVLVSGLASRYILNTKIASSANGRVAILWEDYDWNTLRKNVRMATSNDNGATWSEPRVILDYQSCNQVDPHPTVVYDSNNNLLMAYSSSLQNKASDIHYMKSTDNGATFTAPRKLTSNTDNSATPEMYIDSLDNINLVYQETNSGVASIYSIRSYDAGKSFSSPVKLGEAAIPEVVAAGRRVQTTDPSYYYVPLSIREGSNLSRPLIGWCSFINFNDSYIRYRLYYTRGE